jgi:hypothetical protein
LEWWQWNCLKLREVGNQRERTPSSKRKTTPVLKWNPMDIEEVVITDVWEANVIFGEYGIRNQGIQGLANTLEYHEWLHWKPIQDFQQ